MAGDVSVGTIAGKVEFEDDGSQSLAKVAGQVDALGAKLDSFGGHLRSVKKDTDETRGSFQGFADQFENLAGRIVERLTIYEALRETLGKVKEAIDFSHQIELLSDQTGIATDELQVLGIATKEYGVDADGLGRAIYNLGRRIAGGDESVVTALSMMGISLKDVEGLNGEQLFLKIENGLGKLEGTAQETAAQDLFGGRIGKSLIAFSKHADEAVESAQKLNAGLSKDTTHTLSDFAVNLEKTGSLLTKLAGSAIKPTADYFNILFTNFTTGTSEMDRMEASINKQAAALVKDAENVNKLTKEEQEQAAAEKFLSTLRSNLVNKPLTDWQEKMLQQLKDMGQATAKNAEAIGVNVVQFKAWEVQAKANEEAAKKFKEGMDAINAVGQNTQKTIEGIDGETVNAIKYYLQAGVSAEKLAAVYGLEAVQVKAINEQMKQETEGRKEIIKLLADQQKAEVDLSKARDQIAMQALQRQTNDELAALEDKHNKGLISEKDYVNRVIAVKMDYLNRSEGIYQKELQAEEAALADDTNKKLAELKVQFDQGKIDQQSYEDAIAIIKKTASDKQEQMDEEAAAARKQRMHDGEKDIADVKKNVDTVADSWGNVAGAIEKSNAKVIELDGTVDTLAQHLAKMDQGGSFEVTSANFEQSLESILTAGGMNPAGLSVQQYRDPMTLAKAGYSMAEIMKYAFDKNYQGGPLPPPQGPKIPGFETGGVGDFGPGTMVMLHGPEAIVPLGPGGGSKMLGGITNYWQVNGTGAMVARQASQIIMRQVGSMVNLPAR